MTSHEPSLSAPRRPHMRVGGSLSTNLLVRPAKVQTIVVLSLMFLKSGSWKTSLVWLYFLCAVHVVLCKSWETKMTCDGERLGCSRDLRFSLMENQFCPLRSNDREILKCYLCNRSTKIDEYIYYTLSAELQKGLLDRLFFALCKWEATKHIGQVDGLTYFRKQVKSDPCSV